MNKQNQKGSKVLFKDMVDNINEKVDDPSSSGLDKYVGLEHLDPETLKISRWGSPADVTSTKLKFYSGDIIFGKRRAYQRKVAVADFDGICSAHAMVLRAKKDVLADGFLEVFMQSDTFFDRAIAISVGSLSPTINWKTLAKQEFHLPPIEEQKRIVKVMQGFEETKAKITDLYELTIREKDDVLKTITATNNFTALKELASINPKEPALSSSAPFVPMDAVLENMRTISYFEEKGKRGGVRFSGGDVIFARITPCLQNGKVAQVSKSQGACAGSTEFIVIRAIDNTSNNDYLYHLTSSGWFRQRAVSLMTGSTGRQRVSAADLKEIDVPAIDCNDQLQIASALNKWDDIRQEAADRLSLLRNLQSGTLNDMLSGTPQ